MSIKRLLNFQGLPMSWMLRKARVSIIIERAISFRTQFILEKNQTATGDDFSASFYAVANGLHAV